MRDIIVPIVLILLGAVWLLNNLNWLPDYYWFWTLGLIAAGITVMALDGITKSSIVAGPMLILLGVFSLLRQGFDIGWNIQLPILLMALGVLLLVARLPAIPERRSKRQNNAPPNLPAAPAPPPVAP